MAAALNVAGASKAGGIERYWRKWRWRKLIENAA
jgi:hypothetical protein